MKKKGVRYWKKRAWVEFSRYIRVRDALKTTGDINYCECITCGKREPTFGTKYIKGIQAGHFVPTRCNAILFDEECTNGQCYGCNCCQGGMWVEYERAMVERFGKAKVAKMKLRKYKIVKYTPDDLEKIYNKYKRKFNDLQNKSS